MANRQAPTGPQLRTGVLPNLIELGLILTSGFVISATVVSLAHFAALATLQGETYAGSLLRPDWGASGAVVANYAPIQYAGSTRLLPLRNELIQRARTPVPGPPGS